jgi:hypothetical protein
LNWQFFYIEKLMTRKKILIFIFVFIGLFCLKTETQAGFGISPPYVKTKNPIFPGAHYEQIITLLRSSADSDLQAKVSVNAPDVASWITFDKGDLFDLPEGSLQVPMIVKVDVPAKAEIGEYTGYINIQIVPKNADGGGVAIALGARVDIDLTVTNETFLDFLVRKTDIPDLEQLKSPWNWKIFSWFFYRIKVAMTIENTGNVKVAPSRVHLDVYDLSERQLLASLDDYSIKKIDPFKTDTINASFPTDLGPGQYWGQIKVYKDKEIVHKNKITFTIAKPGGLAGKNKLGPWPYVMMAGLIILVLIILAILVKIKIWKYIFRLLYILCWPLRFTALKIKQGLHALKMKFWRWMHRKASQYQNDDSAKDTNKKR